MKLFKLLSILIMFSVSLPVIAQPVSPTKELVPKSTVKEIDKLDLPYKPKDLEDDEDLFTDEELMDDMTLEDEEQKKIDWSQIPYIPSKYPELKPAQDPEI